MRGIGLILLAVLAGCGKESEEGLRLYVAASLSEFAEEFAAKSPVPVRVRAEASGALSREIAQGAPADVFLSSDPRWLDVLEAKGLLVPESRRVFAGNRLVAAVPKGSPPLSSLEDMAGLESVALGEPDSVPAGRYAMEALRRAGLWERLSSARVLTRDVRMALALAERGQVRGAIVYASDMTSARNTEIGYAIPDSLHPPIRLEGAVIAASRNPAEAARLLESLRTPRGRKLLEAHGLIPAP